MHVIQSPSAFQGVVGTFMGRDALSLTAKHLKLQPSDTVLLPAYVCQEVLKPFVGRAKTAFYDIALDLTIAPETTEKLIRQHQAKALVFVNYFGFLQPHRIEIQRLCKEHRVVLIEDCAHSLLTEGSGSTGDISIFSFRKHLPLPDGGGVRLPEGACADVDFSSRLYSNVLSVLSRTKSALNVRSTALSRSGIEGQAQAAVDKRILPMSTFAKRAISRVKPAEVVRKCREDYLRWEQIMAQCDVATPVFPSLPSGVCPLGFPMRSSRREEIVESLGKRGVWLKRYWRLSSLVGGEHASSHTLAKEVFALPVYPELMPEHIKIIADVLVKDASPKHTEMCAANA